MSITVTSNRDSLLDEAKAYVIIVLRDDSIMTAEFIGI